MMAAAALSGIAAAGVLVAALTVPAGGVRGPGPTALMRELQQIQDRMARGDMAATAQRADLRARIEAHLAASAPAQAPNPSGEDDPELRAALILVLSGGRSEILKNRGLPSAETGEADGAGQVREISRALIEGVIAYGEGRQADAAQALLDIEADGLPPTLASHLALVQGLLAMTYNPARVPEFLDKARLLSPGTLIEDAALRHLAETAGLSGDRTSFEARASAYFRRFPRSVFADAFADKFAAVVAQKAAAPSDSYDVRLQTMLAKLPPDRRARTYLLIAERATIAGLPHLALTASSEAAKLLAFGTAEYERSQLFRTIALAVTAPDGEGAAMLDRIDTDRLVSEDVRLLDAVRRLNRAILEKPAENSAVAASDADLARSAVARRAGAKLAEIDRLLRRAGHQEERSQ